MATTNKTKAAADQASALYKSLLDYAIEANRAFVGGMERTWQEQVEAVEGAVERFKPLADAKQPKDLVSAQFAFATDLNKQAVATTNNLIQIQRDTGSELRDIADASVKAIVAALPKAA